MPRSRNISTAFFVLTLCLIQLCLLQVSVGKKQADAAGDKCSNYSNQTCDVCVKEDGCAFCENNKKCMTFSESDVLHKSCDGQDWKYKQCIVSGKVLLIALPVAGVVVLIALGCCIYCCCCRKKKKMRGPGKEEAKWRRQREEIEVKHKERREERQKKHDEIRKKYGLYRKDTDNDGEDGRYHRFDNAAMA